LFTQGGIVPILILISDTHGLHNKVQLPEGDILVHAGDFMNTGADLWEAWDFTKWWNAQPHPHKVLVGGNHDRALAMRPDDVLKYFENTNYLCDNAVTIHGLKFYGAPWTPTFMNWAFMRDRGENIKQHWDKIPNDVDVLITHGPPQGILDKSKKFGDDLGCADLREAIDRVKPQLCVFGHIHGGFGEAYTYHENLTVVHYANVAQLDEKYKVTRKPVVVDLEGSKNI
jgi:Icc-related predicted phosphoesterase